MQENAKIVFKKDQKAQMATLLLNVTERFYFLQKIDIFTTFSMAQSFFQIKVEFFLRTHAHFFTSIHFVFKDIEIMVKH
jgi:hypothetical protein